MVVSYFPLPEEQKYCLHISRSEELLGSRRGALKCSVCHENDSLLVSERQGR